MSRDDIPFIDKEAELERCLREITLEHEESFSDFYWKIHEKIVCMSNRFLTNECLSESEIQAANFFLCEDSLFMLNFFSNDHGKFLEIFNVFFQGIILAFFECNLENNYLQEKQKAILLSELPYRVDPNENVLMLLASQKFQHCIDLLKKFNPVETNPGFYFSKQLIENFIVDFHRHLQGQQKYQNKVSYEVYYDIVQTLSTKINDTTSDLKITRTSLSTHSVFCPKTTQGSSQQNNNFTCGTTKF